MVGRWLPARRLPVSIFADYETLLVLQAAASIARRETAISELPISVETASSQSVPRLDDDCRTMMFLSTL
jgi:hypothetical protein